MLNLGTQLTKLLYNIYKAFSLTAIGMIETVYFVVVKKVTASAILTTTCTKPTTISARPLRLQKHSAPTVFWLLEIFWQQRRSVQFSSV